MGEQERIGRVLYLLAQALFASKTDLEQAHALTEQSLFHLRKVGHKPFIASALVLPGQIYWEQGKQSRAREQAEAGLMLLRELGDRGATAEALIGLARVRAYQSDFAAAEQLYRESFALLQEIHDKEFIPSCLEGLAAVKAEAGELVWAARLWGVAEAWREAIGTPIPPIYRLDYQQAVAAACTRSGQETFDMEWMQGRTMSPEQALANQSI